MTKSIAGIILKNVGKKFLKFYLDEVFPDKQEIKLLIDEETFYIKCKEVVNSINYDRDSIFPDLARDIKYSTIMDAFDFVKTDYKIFRGSSEEDNGYIALAIAVYQVLLSYKKLEARVDLNEVGIGQYYIQIIENYYSLECIYRNNSQTALNTISRIYFSYQDDLWDAVKNLFESKGKLFNNPQRRTGPGRYVQYPENQNVISWQKLHEVIYNFRNLDIDRDYDIDFFREHYHLDNSEFAIPLIYRAYKSWKSHYIDNNPKNKNSGNSIDLEQIFFYSDGSLSDDYEKLNVEDIVDNKPVYFYQINKDLWCTEPSSEDTNVGLLLKVEQVQDYSQYVILEKIKLENENYKFLAFDIDDLVDTELYRKFYPEEKIITEKQYEVLDGIKLCGNTYLDGPGLLPKVKFFINSKIAEVTFNDRTIKCDTENNILNLKNYVPLNYIGEINIKVPYSEIDFSIKIQSNLVQIVNRDIKGWSLETLAPATELNKNCLQGLNYYEFEELSDEELFDYSNLDNEEDNIDIPVPKPYVNCCMGGNINILNSDLLKAQKKRIKEFLERLRIGNEKTIAEILFSLRRYDFDFSLNKLLSYYRLIKQCVLEEYFDKNQLFVIFYAAKSENETNSSVTVYIKRVSYKENIYVASSTQQYFEYININGKRFYDDRPFTVSLDNISKSLKTICRNINYEYAYNSELNSDYGTDFLEFYEVLLNNNISIKKCENLTFRINLQNLNRSENNGNNNYFNFEKLQVRESSRPLNSREKLQFIQKRLYKLIQIKGKVTWKQILDFVKLQDVVIPQDTSLEQEDISERKNYNIFDIFFPLYNVGLIDVCWTKKYEVAYYVPEINLVTSIPGCGKIKSQPEFPDFRVYPEDVCRSPDVEKFQALKILKTVPNLVDLVKNNWTKVLITDDNLLQYGFYFGSSDNIDKPRFIYLSESERKDFKGLCRKTCDKRTMFREPSYLRLSSGEIYQVPMRNINPNAERIAKMIQRSLNVEETTVKRLIYNRNDKTLTCHLSDIPIPVLRCLFICDALKLGNNQIFLNKKESNISTFTINDDIYKELIRIFNSNLFKEI